MNKISLRKEILAERSKIGKKDHRDKGESIINRFKSSDLYKNAKMIMIYISFGTEIHNHEFIKDALAEGKEIVVPVTFHSPRMMKPSQIYSFDDLEPGYYNILSPKEEHISYVDKSQIDVIIVPGAVFDKEGYRIGYGGGYYDRFLADFKKPKVSFAFEMQLRDEVPKEDFDVPVDYIITEDRFIEI